MKNTEKQLPFQKQQDGGDENQRGGVWGGSQEEAVGEGKNTSQWGD